MCNKLKHGGPDDEGLYSNKANNLVLGHRRLALIDLSPGGHQPMAYAAERYWITYNGELYNFPELKTELQQAGFSFTSNSDTEVILAAFAAWGTHAFRRFNGMFAFVLWDTVTENIYLVRDGAGIKPLYYSITQTGLAFASEVRALAGLPWLQQQNTHWPVYMLAYGHLPEPVTTLQHVQPLPKGCFIQYHVPTRAYDLQNFCLFQYREDIGDREEAIQKIRETLRAAVKRHLISDAPIGVFLSGGIDSGIMALLAAETHKEELKTLSIKFNEAAYTEEKYQQLLLNQLQCAVWQESLTREQFNHHLPDIMNAMDLPGCDGINTWFISKAAKESGLKAVISGLGGDELFGGYPSFTRMPTVNLLQKMPDALLKTGRHFGSKKVRRLANLSLGSTRGTYLVLRGQFIPTAIARQLDAEELEVWRILESSPVLNDVRSLSTGNQAGWIEMNMYMQNQLLRDADVMSMAHGIEIRVPFLDKEFIQLVHGLQSELKYGGALPKQLLIDSFKDILPRGVWDRPKMGFSFPFAEWLKDNELVRESLSASGKKGKDNYKRFSAGKMHWSHLMSLMLVSKFSHAA